MANEPASFDSTLQALVDVSANLHGSGTFSEISLRTLARYVLRRSPLSFSVETGSGASTILLSKLSLNHLVFTVDSGTGSLDNVLQSPLFDSRNVTVIEGPTQLTLPRFAFSQPIDFALIDGPHGYPFPDLEYYYLYRHIAPGGTLVVDDIQIKTIHNLYEFLKVDTMWRLEQVVENTAFFIRTDAPTFPPTGDGWWLQRYNNPAAES